MRSVVLLRFVQELSLGEIAAALDCPLGTVKSRLHAAPRRLRADLRRASTVEPADAARRGAVLAGPRGGASTIRLRRPWRNAERARTTPPARPRPPAAVSARPAAELKVPGVLLAIKRVRDEQVPASARSVRHGNELPDSSDRLDRGVYPTARGCASHPAQGTVLASAASGAVPAPARFYRPIWRAVPRCRACSEHRGRGRRRPAQAAPTELAGAPKEMVSPASVERPRPARFGAPQATPLWRAPSDT